MNYRGKSAKQIVAEIDHFVDTAVVCLPCNLVNQYTVKDRGSTRYAYCNKCGKLIDILPKETHRK